MPDAGSLAGDWKIVLCAVLGFGAMLLFLFRVDELIARHRKSGKRWERRIVGRDSEGRPLHTDPDGRPWKR